MRRGYLNAPVEVGLDVVSAARRVAIDRRRRTSPGLARLRAVRPPVRRRRAGRSTAAVCSAAAASMRLLGGGDRRRSAARADAGRGAASPAHGRTLRRRDVDVARSPRGASSRAVAARAPRRSSLPAGRRRAEAHVWPAAQLEVEPALVGLAMPDAAPGSGRAAPPAPDLREHDGRSGARPGRGHVAGQPDARQRQRSPSAAPSPITRPVARER